MAGPLACELCQRQAQTETLSTGVSRVDGVGAAVQVKGVVQRGGDARNTATQEMKIQTFRDLTSFGWDRR